ncbi:hypothetical protein EV189_0366 [Motilibacter rhizosphaerae]|uniref:Uncharacterized protein n=1 Tax=Motilibacter rhizosphaerae TaxID=598652 RepID=A0A4Q7NV74_9ACTN|nr:hypothetical protein [Motilibacter rhizosphaerae]RZS91133.1 hypothetical protein EV189_0366 [Motilibacter rhizosphaerae]
MTADALDLRAVVDDLGPIPCANPTCRTPLRPVEPGTRGRRSPYCSDGRCKGEVHRQRQRLRKVHALLLAEHPDSSELSQHRAMVNHVERLMTAYGLEPDARDPRPGRRRPDEGSVTGGVGRAVADAPAPRPEPITTFVSNPAIWLDGCTQREFDEHQRRLGKHLQAAITNLRTLTGGKSLATVQATLGSVYDNVAGAQSHFRSLDLAVIRGDPTDADAAERSTGEHREPTGQAPTF